MSKLNVVLNVTNDNGGNKTAKDFSYKLTGNNNPPSETFAGVGENGTTHTLNPGTVSTAVKGVTPNSSFIIFPPNQSYKVSMNQCKNIDLTENQTYTCTITVDDQIPAKLIVITKVINDNLGKKVAKDFSYSVTGNNKPPSTIFTGVSGKGTNITLNPGTVSVNMKGLIASLSSINFPPNQSYKVSMNNCKNYFYNMRFGLIDAEPLIKRFFDREEKVKSDEEALRLREQEIARREKALERALEDHLKNQKLTQEEIDQIIEPDAVF